MTEVFLRVLDYLPRSKSRLLISKKDINTSMAPYVMGREQDWNELMFLMESETAHLVRNLYIPGHYDRQQIQKLIWFLRKRGMEHFDKLTMKINLVHTVLRNLGPSYLDSLEYDVSSTNETDAMTFPAFTRDIKMYRGVIQNLPDRIVNLSLKYVEIPDSVMEAIGTAKFLATLHLEGDNIVLRGLPQFLEKLEMISCRNLSFGEKPNYNYHCEYLTHLEYTVSSGQREIFIFPEALVSSMITSLTHLSIRKDFITTEDSFPPFLDKLGELEELRLTGVYVGNHPLPASIKILTITSSCRGIRSRELNPLPALTELNIPYTNEFVPIMTDILQTSPHLTSLNVGCKQVPRMTSIRPFLDPEVSPPSGIFPQVKIFRSYSFFTARRFFSWAPNNIVYRLFPNLTTIEWYGDEFEWKADFPEKKFYMRTNSWLTNLITVPLEHTQFEKFHFVFTGQYTSNQHKANLPLTTTEVTLTFEGYKGDPEAGIYLHKEGSLVTVEYDIPRIQKQEKIESLQTITLELSTLSDMIYTGIQLK